MEIQYALNQTKFKKYFSEYQKALQNTDWLDKEAYKFRFANWLYTRVNFNEQTDEEILKICLESQSQSFNNEGAGEATRFLDTSMHKNKKNFISLADIRVLRKLAAGVSYDEKTFADLFISFPLMSAWAGTLMPTTYRVYSYADKNDTRNPLEYLFDVKLPRRGFKSFRLNQQLANVIFDEIYERRADVQKPILEKLDKDKLGFIDLAWVAQDFGYFVQQHEEVVEA